jgi:surface antigen
MILTFALLGVLRSQPVIRPLLKPLKSVAPVKHLDFIPFPTAPPGTYANTYSPGNCTWYVASIKKIPNTWGNANTWSIRAQGDGLTVSDIPIVGAIAASSGGSLGHVAIVREVSNNEVRLDEMNVMGLGVASSRWVSTSSYIYIYT